MRLVMMRQLILGESPATNAETFVLTTLEARIGSKTNRLTVYNLLYMGKNILLYRVLRYNAINDKAKLQKTAWLLLLHNHLMNSAHSIYSYYLSKAKIGLRLTSTSFFGQSSWQQ